MPMPLSHKLVPVPGLRDDLGHRKMGQSARNSQPALAGEVNMRGYELLMAQLTVFAYRRLPRAGCDLQPGWPPDRIGNIVSLDRLSADVQRGIRVDRSPGLARASGRFFRSEHSIGHFPGWQHREG